jgi:hypothetical protein
MKSINIEKLMGHSIGISDSYYRATEKELLEDHLKAVPLLTIGGENRLQKDMEKLVEQSKNNANNMELLLNEKEKAIATLSERGSINEDVIANLSDQIIKLMNEIEILKRRSKVC